MSIVDRSYFSLVETHREDGKVRQRSIRYLGTKRPRGPQKGLKGGSGIKGGELCR